MAKTPKEKVQEITLEPESLPATEIPQYRRDIFPKNLVLSAADLHDFSELVLKINENAIKLEIDNINKGSSEQLQEH